MIECTLPWPPSVNRYWRHVVIGRGARVLLSAEGRRYQAAAAKHLMIQRQARQWPVLPLAGRLAVEIDAYPPDRRARDLDNVCKALLDAIQHAGLILDDSQIDSLLVRRCGVIRGGWVVLRAQEIATATEEAA